MNNAKHTEWKVGMFVLIGLVLVAALMLNFSKGITRFKSTYKLHLIMTTVSGLKPHADVMMSGVPVGNVVDTELTQEGRAVEIVVQILSKYQIRTNANFHIDALGFLGDQYIAIIPSTNAAAPFLKDGDTVIGEEPFNLQEAVKSTSGLLETAKQTLKDLDQAITNVNRTVLNDQTLTNFGLAVSNFYTLTTDAGTMFHQIGSIITTNTDPINSAVKNIQDVSKKLDKMADDLRVIISTNSAEIATAVSNFRDTSASLKQTTDELQQGKGVAGALLKDERMKRQVEDLIQNLNSMSANFAIFGSNLNQRGLWSMLRTPKTPPPRAPAPALGTAPRRAQ
jgi:phospholipid/cholesterol/gamma-HCH transport system substrate-binding protein